MTSSQDPSIKKEPLAGQDLGSVEIHAERPGSPARTAQKPELAATSFKFDVARPSEESPDMRLLNSRLSETPSLDPLLAELEEQSSKEASTPPLQENTETEPIDVFTRVMNWAADVLKRLEDRLLGRNKLATPPLGLTTKRKRKIRTASGDEIEIDEGIEPLEQPRKDIEQQSREARKEQPDPEIIEEAPRAAKKPQAPLMTEGSLPETEPPEGKSRR